MIVHDMEQRTQEWYEIKKGVVGGTLAKGLFVKSDTLLIDLISQKTEDFVEDDHFISFDMQRGIDLEPEAIAELSRAVFVEFFPVGFLQNSDFPILGISPDGISKDHTIQCEVKCPAAKKHTSTLINNEIPSEHINQVLHAFVVNDKLEKNYFASFRPESNISPLWYKEITRESLIDLGTKSKPNVKSVSEWVEIALESAKELNGIIDITIIELETRYN